MKRIIIGSILIICNTFAFSYGYDDYQNRVYQQESLRLQEEQMRQQQQQYMDAQRQKLEQSRVENSRNRLGERFF